MREPIASLLNSAGAAASRFRRSRAFTLVEVLIAVGAIALVGVVLAAAFDVTGRTVSGGRRLAAFNAYAALLERQMRQDFAAMSRRGYLVIRNEQANGGNPVPGHAEDASGGRRRRVDEVMFFAEGDFLSAREPLHPWFVARGSAARIYYGHGQRARPMAAGGYLEPRLADQHYMGNDRLGIQDLGNPNRFAIDWTLLRQVTVLRPPSDTLPVIPTPAPFGLSPNEMRDNDVQVALQPAASSIFRSIAEVEPASYPSNAIRSDSLDQYPAFSSGVVDIATTSLAEISSIVNASMLTPDQVAGASGFSAPSGLFQPYDIDNTVLERMQSWMLDGFPTYSGEPDLSQTLGAGNAPARLRYEPAPTNYLQVLSNYTDLELATRRADQLMLGSAAFLPHCTEFIVEWSFGETFPSDPSDGNYVAGREGEIVWYGQERGNEAKPYGWGDIWHDAGNQGSWHTISYKRVDPRVVAFHPVNPELIHGAGVSIPPSSDTDPLVSLFGFVDPYFNPDGNNDGDLNDPEDAASPSLPWAWPKLVRVTVTLADPSDPSFEQTYQFVLETPGHPPQ